MNRNLYDIKLKETPKVLPFTPKKRNLPGGFSIRTPVGTNYQQHHYIISIAEYRSSQEVGFVAMDVASSDLHLYQYVDSYSFNQTLILLFNYDPKEILVSDTTFDSLLTMMIRHEFQLVVLNSIRRKYFNESAGLRLLQKHGTSESFSEVQFDNSKYLCLSAAGALLNYIELTQTISFAPRSLNIKMESFEGRMKLDTSTVINLELIDSSLSLESPKKKNCSLFGMLNHCCTQSGARILRSNILQPLSDIETLSMRLECIEYLISDESLFFQLITILPQFTDLDLLLSRLSQISKNITEISIKSTILDFMHIKNSLILINSIRKVLENSRNLLLKQIKNNLENENAKLIEKAIDEILDDSNVNLSSTRKYGEYSENQIILCIKPGIYGYLDASRATYIETLEEIHKLVDRYKKVYQIWNIKLHYNISRGYHLLVQNLASLPSEFIKQVKKGKKIFCSTTELLSLEARRKEGYANIIRMIYIIMQEPIQFIRESMDYFFTCVESISYLDFLLSLANVISLSEQYSKPSFNLNGPTVIKKSRHPILEKITPDFVSNDAFIDENSNLQIITGGNSSGKTTYIRQIALITIMAHIGCFVPAEHASFRIVDNLMISFSHSDIQPSIDKSTSMFFMEIREISYILRNISGHSLIFFDELGRSTSTIDGLSICYGTCEYLATTPAYIFFVTHFAEITDLALQYSNVKNMNFAANINSKNQIEYLFKVKQDKSDEFNSFYGIRIAKSMGFHPKILNDAMEISHYLKSNGHHSNTKNKKIELMRSLLALSKSTLSPEGIFQYLITLKREYIDIFLNENQNMNSSIAED